MKNNMRNVYLFDMDSTLLEMDQDEFIYEYFKLVAQEAYKHNLNPNEFMEEFKRSAYMMLKNNGDVSNEEYFWALMSQKYNKEDIEKVFNDFYNGSYDNLEKLVKRTNNPKEIIDKLKKKNKRIVLATAPLFPYLAIEKRIRWAGLDPKDFELVTSYEYSRFCKPKYEYYMEILNKLNIKEEECYMVGNDLDDDFSYLPKGIKKILITNYMLNRNNKIINKDDFEFIGSIEEFNKMI